MRRPGDRLRAFAARFCSAETMARLIDPVIADLQAEHSQALRHGRLWRSRWVRLAGYIAFAKVFVICEWSSVRDAHQLNRVVGFSLGAVALVTAVMIAIPYYNQHTYPDLQVNRWQAMIFLLPQALAVSVPIGITMGLAMGLAKQRMSARLTVVVAAMAFVCSIGSLANLGWLVPSANQAFRTAVFQRVSQSPPLKGDNELTLPELGRRMARSGTFPVDSNGLDEFTRLQVAYHVRWAFAFATFSLALFMLSLLAWTGKRWAVGCGVVVAIFGYYVLLYVSRLFALSHDLAPPVALWLPNFVFTLLSAALIVLSARRRAGRPSPAAS
jgi:hypothetical protein